MSRKSYTHPQVFLCRCGARYLVRSEQETPEDGDGWAGVRTRLRFSDWYAPGKFASRCGSCGRELHQVHADAPKPRDAVFADGRRVI